jgi:hypothetical protein
MPSAARKRHALLPFARIVEVIVVLAVTLTGGGRGAGAVRLSHGQSAAARVRHLTSSSLSAGKAALGALAEHKSFTSARGGFGSSSSSNRRVDPSSSSTNNNNSNGTNVTGLIPLTVKVPGGAGIMVRAMDDTDKDVQAFAGLFPAMNDSVVLLKEMDASQEKIKALRVKSAEKQNFLDELQVGGCDTTHPDRCRRGEGVATE